VLLPAFEKHYGFKRTAREIEFFAEHDAADIEHSRRQGELCAKYLDTPELESRALKVAEEICILRWASITDLYRRSAPREGDSAAGSGLSEIRSPAGDFGEHRARFVAGPCFASNRARLTGRTGPRDVFEGRRSQRTALDIQYPDLSRERRKMRTVWRSGSNSN
jgi:hypothetical protein